MPLENGERQSRTPERQSTPSFRPPKSNQSQKLTKCLKTTGLSRERGAEHRRSSMKRTRCVVFVRAVGVPSFGVDGSPLPYCRFDARYMAVTRKKRVISPPPQSRRLCNPAALFPRAFSAALIRPKCALEVVFKYLGSSILRVASTCANTSLHPYHTCRIHYLGRD